MTASREPAPRPADDAPTVRLRLVGELPTPTPRPRMTLVGDLPTTTLPATAEPGEDVPPAPTPLPVTPPAPRPQKSMARRIARKILGPNLLTKRD